MMVEFKVRYERSAQFGEEYGDGTDETSVVSGPSEIEARVAVAKFFDEEIVSVLPSDGTDLGRQLDVFIHEGRDFVQVDEYFDNYGPGFVRDTYTVARVR